MRYLSLFSGIEAATVAWESLGCEAVALAMLKPLTREEQELGQMSLFATTEREV